MGVPGAKAVLVGVYPSASRGPQPVGILVLGSTSKSMTKPTSGPMAKVAAETP